MLFHSIVPLAFALASLGVAAPTSGNDATRVVALYPTASASLPVGSASHGNATIKTSIFEQIPGPPAGWVRNYDAELDKTSYRMKLRIQLADFSRYSIHNLLVKIATPGDELYGNHLTRDEVEDMLNAEDDIKDMFSAQHLARNRVLEWLASKEGTLSGRATIVPGNAITFSGSLADAERILETEYWEYINTRTGETLIRTLQYSLPDSLRGYVTKVQPTISFGVAPRPPRNPNGANAQIRNGANGRNRNGARARDDDLLSFLRTLFSIYVDV
ncbi:hypothetical protein BUE80_DR013545 [Diplocarpon rosae]|nr:hypothetical protein BUE80_DR013545 [Diplocarpon rosae]